MPAASSQEVKSMITINYQSIKILGKKRIKLSIVSSKLTSSWGNKIYINGTTMKQIQRNGLYKQVTSKIRVLI